MSRTQNQGVFFEKKKKVLKKMHFLKLIASLQLKADGWNTVQLPVQGIPVASLRVFLPLVSVRVDTSCVNTKGGITWHCVFPSALVCMGLDEESLIRPKSSNNITGVNYTLLWHARFSIYSTSKRWWSPDFWTINSMTLRIPTPNPMGFEWHSGSTEWNLCKDPLAFSCWFPVGHLHYSHQTKKTTRCPLHPRCLDLYKQKTKKKNDFLLDDLSENKHTRITSSIFLLEDPHAWPRVHMVSKPEPGSILTIHNETKDSR